MKKLALLLLTALQAMISLAQTPPMPPQFPQFPQLPIGNFTNSMAPNAKRPKTYTALCPHCRTKFSNLHPINITTNGGMGTNGGTIIQRTMTFACPSRDCLQTFDSKNTVFVPESIAVEDEPTPLPGVPMPSAAIVPTDPNLRLSVSLTNIAGAWPTMKVPTNVLTGNITLGVGPLVVVKFTTEVGKNYKCQASDDNYSPGDPRKTWIDGFTVPGTGMPAVQYEAATHPSRIYRVVEPSL